jgi:hypothetical protein
MRRVTARHIVLSAVTAIAISAGGASAASASRDNPAICNDDTTVTTDSSPQDILTVLDSQPWTQVCHVKSRA